MHVIDHYFQNKYVISHTEPRPKITHSRARRTRLGVLLRAKAEESRVEGVLGSQANRGLLDIDDTGSLVKCRCIGLVAVPNRRFPLSSIDQFYWLPFWILLPYIGGQAVSEGRFKIRSVPTHSYLFLPLCIN